MGSSIGGVLDVSRCMVKCILYAVSWIALTGSQGFADKESLGPNDKVTLYLQYTSGFSRSWYSQVDDVTGKKWGDLVEVLRTPVINVKGNSTQMIQFAGEGGSDIIYGYPSTFYGYRDQGILMPLNPYVWKIKQDAQGRYLRDEKGAWQYELDEQGERILIMEKWKEIPERFYGMYLSGDDVLALPRVMETLGLLWRKDMFEYAGLDPEKPPDTWEEVYEYSLKICASYPKESNVKGFILDSSWKIPTFVRGFGAVIAKKYKTYGSNDELKAYADMEHQILTAPDGTDLSEKHYEWESAFDTEEYYDAVRFFRKMRWVKYVVGPDNEPIVVQLPDENVSIESETLGAGRWDGDEVVFAQKRFSKDEIRQGVMGVRLMGEIDEYRYLSERRKQHTAFLAGYGAMKVDYPDTVRYNDFTRLGKNTVGAGVIPRGPAGRYATTGGHLLGINKKCAEGPELARRAFAVLERVIGADSYEREVIGHEFSSFGHLNQIWRDDHEQLLERIIAIDQSLTEKDPTELAWETNHRAAVEAINQTAFPEPYAVFYSQLLARFMVPAWERLLTEEDYDYEYGFAETAALMDKEWVKAGRQLVSFRSHPKLGAAVIALFLSLLVMTVLAFRYILKRYSDGRVDTGLKGMHRRRDLILMLSPCLLLIAVFQYYPVLHSIPIAFQDYRIGDGTVWIGLKNFIELVSSDRTYETLLVSAYYLFLSVLIGFFLPLVIALIMAEVRRFQHFYRVSFYLPATVSAVVFAVFWRQMLEPNNNGIFNRFLDYWGFEGQTWLMSDTWAMPCVVMIAVWSTMAPAILVYVAALKSIPQEVFEAAVMDGANYWRRTWSVSLGYIKPILIINFTGTVIGAFKASESVFILTGGGPDFATQTFALEIFVQAFIYLKLGYATALSWIMGAIILSFTILQLRALRDAQFQRIELY